MSRKLVAPLAFLAACALAAAAGAREYRYFEGSDTVFYQSFGNRIERVVEPDFHLTRAERAFAKGHLAYAAENLEKAAAGFGYFGQRAAGEERRQLETTRRALLKFAREVRRGNVEEVTTLERAVADARRVLAGQAPTTAPAADPAEAAPAAEPAQS